jgi:oxalate decarboxylase
MREAFANPIDTIALAKLKVENTGDTDLVFLGLFKTDRYQEAALSDWLTHSPSEMPMQTLNISRETLAKLPMDRA